MASLERGTGTESDPTEKGKAAEAGLDKQYRRQVVVFPRERFERKFRREYDARKIGHHVALLGVPNESENFVVELFYLLFVVLPGHLFALVALGLQRQMEWTPGLAGECDESVVGHAKLTART